MKNQYALRVFNVEPQSAGRATKSEKTQPYYRDCIYKKGLESAKLESVNIR